MKRFVCAVSVALLTAGCATGHHRPRFVARAVIIAVNECPGSVILIDSARGPERRLFYSQKDTFVLGTSIALARGFDASNPSRYLGSAEWRGGSSQGRSGRGGYYRYTPVEEDTWHIKELSGGAGCGELPPGSNPGTGRSGRGGSGRSGRGGTP